MTADVTFNRIDLCCASCTNNSKDPHFIYCLRHLQRAFDVVVALLVNALKQHRICHRKRIFSRYAKFFSGYGTQK